MANMKSKVVFICTSCGSETSKWQGQCPSCGDWNTLQETVKAKLGKNASVSGPGSVQKLDAVAADTASRLSVGISEFDRVVGGGLVSGSTLVLGGHPGAGKSTLLLQIGCQIAARRPVLYVAGEESLEQVADRGRRLNLPLGQIGAIAETDVTAIVRIIAASKPALVIIDSIQVMFHPDIDSLPGSITQVRECAALLNRYAKQHSVTMILIGHITKSEGLAGPMTLNHLVDVTMMLSSTDDTRYRILRSDKNRFGSTSELGVFAMTSAGMKEVPNPSAIFLSRSNEGMPGSIVTPIWEGSRALLVEIQALVDQSPLGNPRRVSLGIENVRTSMLLAVLHRHGGLAVHDQDVYTNVVGGIRVSETSVDLAVLLAITSSLQGRVIPSHVIAFGEVGLSGEVRPSPNGQDRIREAVKHGFRVAIVPAANAPREVSSDVQVVAVESLQQALDWMSSL